MSSGPAAETREVVILVAISKRSCPFLARLVGLEGTDDVVAPVSSGATDDLDPILDQDV
jgi:hypothetical protein